MHVSSSTVFMFSIHKASTGPSNTTHLPGKSHQQRQFEHRQALPGLEGRLRCPYRQSLLLSATACLTRVEARPSVHSLVSWLYSPYSSPMFIALGKRTSMWQS